MSAKNSIRIASGSGFWGDWAKAPRYQLESGKVDYLILDYLAEVTMSVLAKQRQRTSAYGFAKDFVDVIHDVADLLTHSKTRIIANAGGVNPEACARAVCEVLSAQNVQKKVAIVEGDNILPAIDELLSKGERFEHFDSKADFSQVKDSLLSANAYIGCSAVVEALHAGADIIITGRVADAALALAPMVYTFAWPEDDWDRLAAGTVAGHILECGAQASGGNDAFNWHAQPNLANIGYPIVEIYEDGCFEVYNHSNLGGNVTKETVCQQLLYEIGDPTSYIVPDVVVDFSTLRLEERNNARIAISKVRGKPKPSHYKVSCSYENGYSTSSTMLYSWPDAFEKAKAAAEIVTSRLAIAKRTPQRIHTEFIGYNACLGQHAPLPGADTPEIQLRIAAHDHDKTCIEQFSRELPPLVLSGPPFATAYAGARGRVSEVYAYWPTLVSRANVTPSWRIIDGQ